MKTKSNIPKFYVTTFFAFFLLLFGLKTFAQEQSSPDFKSFKITIEKTDKGLKMFSHKGSAWIDISFSLADYVPQAIDEYGMTELGKVSTDKHPEYADFLFTITKTEEGITLKGIEGTAWKELSFSLKKYRRQSIDQYGMTD